MFQREEGQNFCVIFTACLGLHVRLCWPFVRVWSVCPCSKEKDELFYTMSFACLGLPVHLCWPVCSCVVCLFIFQREGGPYLCSILCLFRPSCSFVLACLFTCGLFVHVPKRRLSFLVWYLCLVMPSFLLVLACLFTCGLFVHVPKRRVSVLCNNYILLVQAFLFIGFGLFVHLWSVCSYVLRREKGELFA